jgi:aminoglycoside phosphotransferase (APT) family kinase protein
MRERYVYETFLAGRDLGIPELYGVVWDESAGRHWLLLEFVEGRTLHHSSIKGRIAAAAWLARLHATIAGHQAELAQPGVLLDYDDAYFLGIAERARQAVGSRSGSLQRGLEAVVSGYEAIAERCSTGPRTLVHGSYRPTNILVDSRVTPVRICPVDWELAAVGPHLHDLAFIADGCDRSTIEHLCDSYAGDARAAGFEVMDTEEVLAEIERLRLHKTLRSLARSTEWAYPDDVVADLVTTAQTIRRGLG